MSEQTAEEYQRQLWHQAEPINRQQLQYYGDMRANEERAKGYRAAKVAAKQRSELFARLRETEIEAIKAEARAGLLAEWQATDVEEWLRKNGHLCGPLDGCVQCNRTREALARAQAQGAATKGHTAACAVNQSRDCDCGRVAHERNMETQKRHLDTQH